jgi:hypothetical protein
MVGIPTMSRMKNNDTALRNDSPKCTSTAMISTRIIGPFFHISRKPSLRLGRSAAVLITLGSATSVSTSMAAIGSSNMMAHAMPVSTGPVRLARLTGLRSEAPMCPDLSRGKAFAQRMLPSQSRGEGTPKRTFWSSNPGILPVLCVTTAGGMKWTVDVTRAMRGSGISGLCVPSCQGRSLRPGLRLHSPSCSLPRTQRGPWHSSRWRRWFYPCHP